MLKQRYVNPLINRNLLRTHHDDDHHHYGCYVVTKTSPNQYDFRMSRIECW